MLPLGRFMKRFDEHFTTLCTRVSLCYGRTNTFTPDVFILTLWKQQNITYMPPLHHYLPIIHSVISIFSTFSMFYLSIYLYSSN